MKSMLIVLLLALGVVECVQDHWFVKNQVTDESCIIIDSDATGSIKINGKDVPFVFANETTAGSGCHESYQAHLANKLVLDFYPQEMDETEAAKWSMSLIFVKTDENNSRLANWNLTTHNIDGTNFTVESNFTREGDASDAVKSSILEGYRCSSLELHFQNDTTVTFNNISAVAFGTINGTVLPADMKYQLCPKDTPSKTSAVVPIVVGCFLGGLVCAVLIAYMIGRYRARSQGYASV
ncbi:unnamed protein product, partial [Mesorhabditis belari]|uniref:Lysosome-associated membrane glycoprotein 2-like transmembrane domain-containing protein n=1 Tax=Mesorhabditis belari TaxID=2138241 RepID=A0AAF3FE48_9BILA